MGIVQIRFSLPIRGLLLLGPEAAGRGGNGRGFAPPSGPIYHVRRPSFAPEAGQGHNHLACASAHVQMGRITGEGWDLVAHPLAQRRTGQVGNSMVLLPAEEAGSQMPAMHGVISQVSRVLPRNPRPAIPGGAGFAGVHRFFLPCSIHKDARPLDLRKVNVTPRAWFTGKSPFSACNRGFLLARLCVFHWLQRLFARGERYV